MSKLIAIFLFLAVNSAFAIPVTWTINGSFANGTTVTGSFDFDADTNVYSNLSVTTGSSPNQDLGNGSYSGSPFASDSNDFEVEGSCGQISTWECAIGMSFASDLNEEVEVITILSGYEASAANALQNGLTGTVTANVVPIPAAAWLFGSALAGLGWARRKKAV